MPVSVQIVTSQTEIRYRLGSDEQRVDATKLLVRYANGTYNGSGTVSDTDKQAALNALRQIAQDKNSGAAVLECLANLNTTELGQKVPTEIQIDAASTLVTGGFSQAAQNIGLATLFNYANGSDATYKKQAITALTSISHTSNLSKSTLNQLINCGLSNPKDLSGVTLCKRELPAIMEVNLMLIALIC
jgi:hypothetical protein